MEIESIEQAMEKLDEIGTEFANLRSQAAGLQQRILDIAQRAGDIVVEPDGEHGKRVCIEVLKRISRMFGNLPIAERPLAYNTKKLRDEIEESLLRGAELAIECNSVPGVGIARLLDCDAVRALMRERANNLAMAFADRIMPKPIDELLEPVEGEA